MNKNGKDWPWLDLGLYHRNRVNFPPDQLVPYHGLYVAWSLDGRRILASGKTRQAVERKLRAAGIDPGQVVGDYIDPPDTVHI